MMEDIHIPPRNRVAYYVSNNGPVKLEKKYV